MPCECAECAAKIDCDSIICTDCMMEIIAKINARTGGRDKGEKQPARAGAKSG